MNLQNFFDLLINSNTFYEYLTKSIILIFFGLSLRQFLVFCGQRWANTYHHLATYIILPVIALMITTVIKNDIALSLGMIGALSIVRFRNPVKSPFELVMFFGLMTIGIVSSVAIYLSTFLYIIIVSVILGIKLFDFISKKFGFNIFQHSFGEGNLIYTIEISASKEIPVFNTKDELINYFFDKKDKNFFYRFNFKNKSELMQFEKKIKNISEILNIRVDMQS